jgi:hypothetical protein
VGVSEDLDATLKEHRLMYGESNVAHIRALSFTFPQQKAMQDVAKEWRDNVVQAGGSLSSWNDDPLIRAAERAVLDEEEDDDDDEDDWTMEMTAQAISMARTATAPHQVEPTVISPFAAAASQDDFESNVVTTTSSGILDFTQENVNKVLEEVRPYLIADGGNVSVERVDAEKLDVYLKLQGACGKNEKKRT